MDDVRRRLRRGTRAATLSVLSVLVASGGMSAAQAVAPDRAGAAEHTVPPAHAQRLVGTATYNLYLGANLQPLFGASDQMELIQLAGQVYKEMEATDFFERATAIADLLVERGPEVVGLQEVALWERGPIGGELEVTYDFLEILLDELDARGMPYRDVSTTWNFSGLLPISFTEQARFADRDVIIVRDDLPTSQLKVSNPQDGLFAAELVIPTEVPGVVFEVPRGWTTVDVKVRGKTFRFANTHLEAFSEQVRNLQAQELLTILGESPHPVVLAGDLNSRPTDLAGAYGMTIAAGFDDAWLASGGDPVGGWTSGQTDSLLDPNQLTHRIDYVLFEPDGIEAVSAEVIGDEEGDRSSPTGFWPSDHAGVVAVLKIAKP